MASIITHPIVPLTLGAIIMTTPRLKRAWQFEWKWVWWGMLFSIIPDGDVVAFKLGIPYEADFGHRGVSHSIFFAVVCSLAFLLTLKRLHTRAHYFALGAFLCIAMLSHPILDMLTTGGLGVALLWPVDNHRYFLPWQVIQVSPIGIKNFLSERGWRVMTSELLTVWLPCAIVFGTHLCFKSLYKK